MRPGGLVPAPECRGYVRRWHIHQALHTDARAADSDGSFIKKSLLDSNLGGPIRIDDWRYTSTVTDVNRSHVVQFGGYDRRADKFDPPRV